MLQKFLLSKSTNGKFRFAEVYSDEEWHDDVKGYIIQRSYGQVGGKTTLSPAIVIDRTKQSRTWKEQLILQYKSEVKKYLDKGYKEVSKHPNECSEEELNEFYGEIATNQFGIIKPQLAKQADKVTNPKIFDKEWIASRKIDGVRCLMYFKDNGVYSASRGGGHYDYSTFHIRTSSLQNIFEKYPTLILDGELYKHGESLQKISGAARLEQTLYDWLEYWIYDCIFMDKLDMKAEDRIAFLTNLAQEYNIGFDPCKEWSKDDAKIQMVPQVKVSGWDNMIDLHNQYVSEGFEGLVIRDPKKPYKPNGRTNDMIKIKQYKDSEFEITGISEGLREEDMCFTLVTEDGIEFKAKPVGTRELKQQYRRDLDKLIGKMATVKYFYLSDDGCPLQPVLKCIRDYD
jgi:DNA ligase-1